MWKTSQNVHSVTNLQPISPEGLHCRVGSHYEMDNISSPVGQSTSFTSHPAVWLIGPFIKWDGSRDGGSLHGFLLTSALARYPLLWVKAMLSPWQCTPFSKKLMSYLEVNQYIGHFPSWREERLVLLGTETYFRYGFSFPTPNASTSTKQKALFIHVPYKSPQTKEHIYSGRWNAVELHSQNLPTLP